MEQKTLLEQKDEILAYIQENSYQLGFNETIFEILEGNLLKYVSDSLRKQLSEDSYNTAVERVAPINLFRKITNKLSTLYVEDPARKTEEEVDQILVDDYTQEMSVNTFMEDLNRAYNAYKWSVIEFYNDDGIKSRVIPSHQFLPYSDDRKNPLKVTAIIKFMGEFSKVPAGKVRSKRTKKYWVYTANEFMALDSDGDLVKEDMVDENGNDIVNEFGILPFVFASKSRYLLVPMPDEDDMKMSILFPVLLTDLNFAAKFLAHSVFYGIDIDSENLKLSPDAVWLFKTDENGKAPEVGTIKPEVSITDVLTLAKEQVGSWLETKNVKAGTVGSASTDGVSSGVAKMVDEADTTTERKSQEKFFKMIELQTWRIIAQMHNTLSKTGVITGKKTFTDPENLIVNIMYAEQKPVLSKAAKVAELKMETEAGFKSKRSAIKELNPEMSEEEIEEELLEISEQSVISIPEAVDGNEEGLDEQDSTGI